MILKSLSKGKKKKLSSVFGFTLVEVMVAVSIFIIVAFVVTSTFLIALDAYRKAKQIQLIVDNVNFAMENMVIDIREGTDYDFNSGTFSFKDYAGENKFYRLSNNKIEKCVQTVSDCQDITSSDVDIVGLNFNIINPSNPPRMVRINVHGQINLRKTMTDLNIQTTIAQRNTGV